jgi:histone-lysine N-methyltransferase SETMAR
MRLTQQEIHKLLHHQFKITKNAAAAARNINQFIGRDVVSTRTAQIWFRKFRDGRRNLGRQHGQGRRVTVDRRELRRRFKRNPTISSAELAKDLCSPTTAQRWLRSRGLRWKKTHELPHELTKGQKDRRVVTCQELLALHRRGGLLRNLITCDESWIFFDNPHRGKQWLSPNQRGVPVPRRPMHGKKLMLCVFWSMRGPVHWELLPPNTSITSNLYCDQLSNVNNAIRVLRGMERWHGPVFFQQDNARPHVSGQTLHHIKETLGWRLVPHPPYSPDLAPSDYHLFQSLKNFLRGQNFRNAEECQNAIGRYFASKVGSNFFERGIRKLPRRWRTVVDLHGDYLVD